MREPCSYMYCSFPSNWLQVDVSRENVTGFTNMVIKKYYKSGYNTLGENLAGVLCRQIISFENYAKAMRKNVPLIYVQDAIYNATNFIDINCPSDVLNKLKKMEYWLTIEFHGNGVTYKIRKAGELKERITINYTSDFPKSQYMELRNRYIEKYGSDSFKNIARNEYRRVKSHIRDIGKMLESLYYGNKFYTEEKSIKFFHIVNELGFDVDNENKYSRTFELLTVIFCSISERIQAKKNEELQSIFFLIEQVLLNYLTVSNADESIIVTYEDIVEHFFKNGNSKHFFEMIDKVLF